MQDYTEESKVVGPVARFVGMTMDELRRALAAIDGIAVLHPLAPDRPRWLAEACRLQASERATLITWYYRDLDAGWSPLCGHEREGPAESWDAIPAFIYTRCPVATPGVGVRPIVELRFDRSGSCTVASAKVTDLQLHAVRTGMAVSSLEQPSAGRRIRLASDLRLPDAASASRVQIAGPCRWLPSCDLGVLLLVAADMRQVASVTIGEDGCALATVTDGRIEGRRLDGRGTQIRAGGEERHDVYAGGPAIKLKGECRAWRAALTIVIRRREEEELLLVGTQPHGAADADAPRIRIAPDRDAMDIVVQSRLVRRLPRPVVREVGDRLMVAARDRKEPEDP